MLSAASPFRWVGAFSVFDKFYARRPRALFPLFYFFRNPSNRMTCVGGTQVLINPRAQIPVEQRLELAILPLQVTDLTNQVRARLQERVVLVQRLLQAFQTRKVLSLMIADIRSQNSRSSRRVP